MSVHRIPSQQPDRATEGSRTSAVRGLALNPLWMVTFAAGVLFGMLAVLLTSG